MRLLNSLTSQTSYTMARNCVYAVTVEFADGATAQAEHTGAYSEFGYQTSVNISCN